MVLQNLLIQKSYLVELNVGTGTPAAGQRVSFVDVPILRDVLLYSVECVSESDLTKSPNNKTTVSLLGCKGCILTLATAAEDVNRYPLADLNPPFQSGLMRWMNGIRLNLSKSYITILDATDVSANESFMFNFIYRSR